MSTVISEKLSFLLVCHRAKRRVNFTKYFFRHVYDLIVPALPLTDILAVGPIINLLEEFIIHIAARDRAILRT